MVQRKINNSQDQVNVTLSQQVGLLLLVASQNWVPAEDSQCESIDYEQ
jgi:hypothetical protein